MRAKFAHLLPPQPHPPPCPSPPSDIEHHASLAHSSAPVRAEISHGGSSGSKDPWTPAAASTRKKQPSHTDSSAPTARPAALSSERRGGQESLSGGGSSLACPQAQYQHVHQSRSSTSRVDSSSVSQHDLASSRRKALGGKEAAAEGANRDGSSCQPTAARDQVRADATKLEEQAFDAGGGAPPGRERSRSNREDCSN